MGLTEAAEDGIIGVILALILGQIITSIYPSLSTTFSNSDVFGTTGPVTLGLIGFLGLIFVIVIIIRMIRSAKKNDDGFSQTGFGQ